MYERNHFETISSYKKITKNAYANLSKQIKMKLKTTLRILFLLLPFFSLVSCNKKTSEPLSLDQIDNNTTKLYYGSTGGVTIIGGDGKYSFSCESSLLKAQMTYSNYISIEPLSIGDAAVTIKDESGNTYLLKVTVVYKTENIVVAKLDATVVGDNMTVASQKELKEKALATIPVKVGGGYRFVYTEGEDQDATKGIVFVYPDKFGTNGIEGTFERAIDKPNDKNNSYITYTLHYGDMNHTFIYPGDTTSASQSSKYPAQFSEDLKEQYKTAYPNLEKVYTSQIIGYKAVE